MSNIINVKEERNILSFEGEIFDIVANSTNFYLKFSLDEEWSKCSIVTVIFSLDGEKYYVELDEDNSCQIPATNASKILFCITAEPDKDSKLSSTILSLDVEASGDTCLEGEHVYEVAHKNLLGIIENLKSGVDIMAKYAEYATIAETSETQVSLTGDESIAGEKNFQDRLKYNSIPIPNFSEIINPNLLLNSNFQINQRKNGVNYTREGEDLYTVDRWYLMNGDGSFSGGNKCTLTCTDANDSPSILCQWVEDGATQLIGETLTLSATIDGVRYSGTTTIPTDLRTVKEDYIYNIVLTENYALRIYVPYVTLRVGAQFVVNPGTTIEIHDVKLEVSEYPTKYVGRSTAEDLALCQRYYVKAKIQGYGFYSTETKIKVLVITPSTMRIGPKLTFMATPSILINGTVIEAEDVSVAAICQNGMHLNIIASGFEENNIYPVYDGIIALDAEMY